MTDEAQANRRTLYEQLCRQHDGIAEFRAKLLGLLPFATGVGVFLLLDDGNVSEAGSPHLLAIGLLGVAVTAGLFIYELRGIQKCNALIDAARSLEHGLSEQFEGAFRARPRAIWGFGATNAARVIYTAVGLAWAYMAAAGIPWLVNNLVGAVLIGALIIGATAGFSLLGGTKVLTMAEKARDLRILGELNKKSFLAEDQGDSAMLEPMLHKEFRIVRSSGRQQKRQEMLNKLASAGEERTILETPIELCDGDSAVVISRIDYSKDGVSQGEYWNTKVFLKVEGQWLCKLWLVTPIEPAEKNEASA